MSIVIDYDMRRRAEAFITKKITSDNFVTQLRSEIVQILREETQNPRIIIPKG